MSKKNANVIGILLGDNAGIGPEIIAKMLLKRRSGYLPLVISSKSIFVEAAQKYAPELSPRIQEVQLGNIQLQDRNKIYIIDIPSKGKIKTGEVSAASGRLMIDSICTAVDLKKRGVIDGILLGPLTKQSLNKADPSFSSEFKLFDREFGTKGSDCAVKRGNIIRSTVVGHFAFKEIVTRLTTDLIYQNGIALYKVLKIFNLQSAGIAVAALNPHAGEDGLFGDEEARIIEPAINKLQKTLDVKVIGPCPADTVFLKGRSREINGIVYLYHDQGNIAMKSCYFDEGVVIFFGIPCALTSPGHGSALDIAGKGKASEKNICHTLDTLLEMVRYEKKQE